MSPWREMPQLTPRRPREVYIPCNALEIQKPPAGSTTEPERAPGPLDRTTMPETKGYELCVRC